MGLERHAFDVEPADKAGLAHIRALLQMVEQQPGAAFQLRSANGSSLELPESVVALLRQGAHILAQGEGITVMPQHREMTTQQAADFLHVSRPFFISLLEKGALPFTLTGTHRRIAYSDVVAYKRRRAAERREQLVELTRLSQENDLYS